MISSEDTDSISEVRLGLLFPSQSDLRIYVLPYDIQRGSQVRINCLKKDLLTGLEKSLNRHLFDCTSVASSTPFLSFGS